MKGVVFTEFVEMLEETFSPELVDELFGAISLPSKGVYTSVGTYDHNELVSLVVELSRRTDTAVPSLIHAFGKHLGKQFVAKYPAFFDAVEDAFGFFEQIDGYVHVEVRKLYPDAELPRFHTRRVGEHGLEVVYESERPFADLAHGLIENTIEHYGESIEIERRPTDNGEVFVLWQKCETPSCQG